MLPTSVSCTHLITYLPAHLLTYLPTHLSTIKYLPTYPPTYLVPGQAAVPTDIVAMDLEAAAAAPASSGRRSQQPLYLMT